MEIVLGWLIFSICVGVLASKRGRSGFGWFLFSVVLTPILGVIMVALLPDLSNAEPPGARVPCPFCKEPVRVGAVKCKHCGSDLTHANQQTPQAPQTPQPGRNIATANSGVREGGLLSVGLALKLGQIAGAVLMIAGVASCSMHHMEQVPTLLSSGFFLYGACRLAAWLREK